jgi:hypothetical protein
VQLSTDGGTLPTGLVAGTAYYAKAPAGNNLQLANTSGGAAIDLTGALAAPVFIGMLPNDFMHAIRVLLTKSSFLDENLGLGRDAPAALHAEGLLMLRPPFPPSGIRPIKGNIDQLVASQDTYGAPSIGWTSFAAGVTAWMEDVTGQERYADQQIQAITRFEVLIATSAA